MQNANSASQRARKDAFGTGSATFSHYAYCVVGPPLKVLATRGQNCILLLPAFASSRPSWLYLLLSTEGFLNY